MYHHSAFNGFDATIEDAEMVELGLSKEVLTEELYVPCHKSRGWIHCIIILDNDNGYRMYLESSKRFLLSAKQFEHGVFLISMHEEFSLIESKPKKGYVAALTKIKDKDRSFQICLTNCRLCDHKLGYYNCGRGYLQREVVAKITHALRPAKAIGSHFTEPLKSISVSIPAVSSADTRAIWCPRCLRIENPNLPMSADVNAALTTTPGVADKFVNKSAEWSAESGCLVVKFEGSRMLTASSKNFVLIKEPKVFEDGSVSEFRKSNSTGAILQFGKMGSSKFALDFRYPLSPLQAFGIALTAFAVANTNTQDTSSSSKAGTPSDSSVRGGGRSNTRNNIGGGGGHENNSVHATPLSLAGLSVFSSFSGFSGRTSPAATSTSEFAARTDGNNGADGGAGMDANDCRHPTDDLISPFSKGNGHRHYY